MIQFTKRDPMGISAAVIIAVFGGATVGWKLNDYVRTKKATNQPIEAITPTCEPCEPCEPCELSKQTLGQLAKEAVAAQLTVPSVSHEEAYFKSLYASTLSTTLTDPVEVARTLQTVLPYGVPSVENLVVRPGFALSFNRRTRNPNWVAEHLRKPPPPPPSPELEGTGTEKRGRARYQFREDYLVPPLFRSRLEDYCRSGYDRGHLAPYANVRCAADSNMDAGDTFFLTNVSPQVGNGFNRHYWARLEKFTRGLVHSWDNVYILSGPLFMPHIRPYTYSRPVRDESGKYVLNEEGERVYEEVTEDRSYVRYHVIGSPANVAVPTHFFKVVLASRERNNDDGHPQLEHAMATFILPNKSIKDTTPLSEYCVSAEEVERAAGISIHPQLLRQQLQAAPNQEQQPVKALETSSADNETTEANVHEFAIEASQQVLDLCVVGECVLPEPNWWKKGAEEAAKREEEEKAKLAALKEPQSVQTTNIQEKPVEVEAKPVEVEAKPVEDQTKPVEVEIQEEPVEGKPVQLKEKLAEVEETPAQTETH